MYTTGEVPANLDKAKRRARHVASNRITEVELPSSRHLFFSLASKLYVTFHIALRVPLVKKMRPPLTRLESATKGWPFHRPHSASVNTRRARTHACAEGPAQGRQRPAVSNLSPRGRQRQKRRSEEQRDASLSRVQLRNGAAPRSATQRPSCRLSSFCACAGRSFT